MYKAKVSFSGVISMAAGETRADIKEDIAKDLLKAGYIVEVKPAVKGVKSANVNKKKGAKE